MVIFFEKIINYLNANKIEYMLSGSMAMSMYVIPRSTRDFDFVIHLPLNAVTDFSKHFKEGFYCDEDSIKDAILHKSMFNIIDFETGFKADLIILKNEAYRQEEFRRRSPYNFLDLDIYVVSPEDLLISKIAWIQQLQSNIQMEDIKSLQAVQNLDWPYIHEWIGKLKLNTFNLLTHG